jgi:two-component system sensor histidine kinase YesM
LIQTAIAVVSLTIIVIATMLISWRITSPIKRLIGYISRIQTGQLDVQIDLRSNDEIGVLASRFQAMMETINNLILREYKLDLANKTNELKALLAQINPHFLNNALQSIGTLALQRGAPEVYSLLSSLARMMHYSMTTMETTVPLHKELEHVQAYLALQKQRFDERLDVVYELDELAFGYSVPKMILQPIAENYFQHGFEPSGAEPGRIAIRSRLADDKLVIAVEDNGVGIAPERWPLLLAALERDAAADDENGIGLSNVRQRLRLYYDDQAEMRVESGASGGVKVTFVLPLRPWPYEAYEGGSGL